jgi:hypothetical protein
MANKEMPPPIPGQETAETPEKSSTVVRPDGGVEESAAERYTREHVDVEHWREND